MKTFILSAGAALLCFFAACKQDDDNGNNRLESVFTDDRYQFTGLAKDPNSAVLFVNYPRWSGPYRFGVVRADANTVTPFPDSLTNAWLGGQDGENKWVCVQSVYFDDGGNLWVLDAAAPNMGAVYQKSYKLVRVNKTTGAWESKYEFDTVASDSSYINDVRVDVPRQFAYLTNSKEGGIIVLNLATGQMRQVLQDHYSVRSDPAYQFIIDGQELMKNGMPVKIHSDGIALTPDGEWLYYKPLTDDKLYRIRTEYLRDWSMNSDVLGTRVEDLGRKASSDGMIFDDAGNLYLSDVQNYRIVRINPNNNHEMTTLLQDDRLIWPDSYSISDGYLYVTCSQIQKQPDYNEGADLRKSAYTIYRIKI